MMLVWLPGEPKAKVVNNLVRVSKGEMTGVKYNKDKDWVGASVGFRRPEGGVRLEAALAWRRRSPGGGVGLRAALASGVLCYRAVLSCCDIVW